MSESDAKPRRIKKRGVRASRVKLERALSESSLERKTQAALADRIADLEGLDAAPKDLVSKVFRELFVDPQTIARVARALGVEAETLYLKEAGAESHAPLLQGEAAPPLSLRSVTRREITLAAISLSAAFVLVFVFAVMATGPTGPWCGLREAIARPHAEDGTLGIMIARFANDSDNRAQQYLSASLAADQNLAPYTSVLATCARPRWSGPGEIRRKLAEIRERARKKLDAASAHLMIWGELEGDDIIVRYVTTRAEVSAFAVEVSGRPLKVDESNIELRLPIGRPSEALADLKRLALELIEPQDNELSLARAAAMQSYKSSADWLRAAIVSQRNLRRTINAEVDPQRWAAVNMQLCYDLRLLGDHEADASHYRQALEACDEALGVRPRERFPRDWAAAQINKASSLIRLHYFASAREGALELLHDAERALSDVVETSAPDAAPQQWITAQRNLGVVYLRLGELTEGDDSSNYFDKGVGLLRAALDAQDPALQPLDWAITQQNICLALYQHGARLGPAGVAQVEEAKARCEDAVGRLSPENTPLDWAMAQNNLAAATAILAQTQGDANNLEVAIGDFTAAQRVYTHDRLPENWAEVELNLGELHCNLAVMKRDPSLFETATAHLDAALEIFIANGNARYQQYAENLAASIYACEPSGIAECVCGG